jgi:hypothetical protein
MACHLDISGRCNSVVLRVVVLRPAHVLTIGLSCLSRKRLYTYTLYK